MFRLGLAALALALFLVPLQALASPLPSAAQAPKNLEIMGDDVVIEAGERVHDVRVFGGDLIVHGEVTGSLASFGGDVHIAGSVAGDVSLFGGDLLLDGTVGGSVKTTGGDVTVRGVVRGDVKTAGGDVELKEGGKVHGRVLEGAGGVDADGLAAFLPMPAWVRRIVPGMVSVTTALLTLLKLVQWSIAWMIGLFMLGLDRLRFGTYEESVTLATLPSLAWGAIAFVMVSTLCGLCVISVIGLPIAGFLMIALGFAMHFGLALAAAAVGSLLPSTWIQTRLWAQLTVGVALCAVASLVPYAGSLLMLAAATAGLGAIVVSHRKPRPVRPAFTPVGITPQG